MRALVEEGSTLFWILIFMLYILIEMWYATCQDCGEGYFNLPRVCSVSSVSSHNTTVTKWKLTSNPWKSPRLGYHLSSSAMHGYVVVVLTRITHCCPTIPAKDLAVSHLTPSCHSQLIACSVENWSEPKSRTQYHPRRDSTRQSCSIQPHHWDCPTCFWIRRTNQPYYMSTVHKQPLPPWHEWQQGCKWRNVSPRSSQEMP